MIQFNAFSMRWLQCSSSSSSLLQHLSQWSLRKLVVILKFNGIQIMLLTIISSPSRQKIFLIDSVTTQVQWDIYDKNISVHVRLDWAWEIIPVGGEVNIRISEGRVWLVWRRGRYSEDHSVLGWWTRLSHSTLHHHFAVGESETTRTWLVR